jgi:hypothetical protein
MKKNHAYIELRNAEAFIKAFARLQEKHDVSVVAVLETSPSGVAPAITLLPRPGCLPHNSLLFDARYVAELFNDVPTIAW